MFPLSHLSKSSFSFSSVTITHAVNESRQLTVVNATMTMAGCGDYNVTKAGTVYRL